MGLGNRMKLTGVWNECNHSFLFQVKLNYIMLVSSAFALVLINITPYIYLRETFVTV